MKKKYDNIQYSVKGSNLRCMYIALNHKQKMVHWCDFEFSF